MEHMDDLLARTARGEKVKYLHFWGHRPRPDGRIGASCLSQWWPTRFTVDGVTYASAEHWMMAYKARLFGDAESEAAAVAAKSPAVAKKVGQAGPRFRRRGVAARAVRTGGGRSGVHKFGGDPELREFLLNTGDRVLVEASPMDRIWGIGLAADDPRAENPASWRGLNLLGFALMDARAELRAS